MNRDRPRTWRLAPATDGQRALLARFGIVAPDDLKQGEASDMIDWAQELGETHASGRWYDDDNDFADDIDDGDAFGPDDHDSEGA